jgi:hypothetical protein
MTKISRRTLLASLMSSPVALTSAPLSLKDHPQFNAPWPLKDETCILSIKYINGFNVFHVLDYDQVDEDNQIFCKGCFGEIDGTIIRATECYDMRKIVGVVKLIDTETQLLAQPFGLGMWEKFNGYEGAMGGHFCTEIVTNGEPFRVTKATINEIGIVEAGKKVHTI